MHGKWWAAAGIAAAALMVTACGSSSTSSGSSAAAPPSASSAPSAASSSVLKVTTIKGVQVLTNAQGMTLYFFAPDTSTKSKCSGSCLKYWPLVPAPASAGSGVTGTVGLITRPNGMKQATYDGHPLYTYIADTAPGQAKGNNLNASGGLWYEATVSGTMPGGTSSSSGSSSSGSSRGSGSGGYGY